MSRKDAAHRLELEARLNDSHSSFVDEGLINSSLVHAIPSHACARALDKCGTTACCASARVPAAARFPRSFAAVVASSCTADDALHNACVGAAMHGVFQKGPRGDHQVCCVLG